MRDYRFSQVCSPALKSVGSYIILVLYVTGNVFCQNLRNFPPLFNAAKLKGLNTEPSQSTCGIPIRSAYCKSATFSASVNECRQAFCVQDCPRRTALPSKDNLLQASGYGACVTADTTNTRPGSEASDYTAVFTAGSLCFLNPLKKPNLGANGAFTITFWMWQNTGNTGTVIEKYTSSRETIFRIRVGSPGLYFHYRTLFGQREIYFPENIPSQKWVHVSFQVYDTSVSYFVDGTGVGYSARGTTGLVGNVLDSSGTYRLGQTNDGTGQLVGRLQNVDFYEETLTNREIAEVYTGVLPPVRIQSSCRCPPTHPRVKPLATSFCIRNGVPDNIGDDILRLNNDSHPLEYLNDGDSNSVWVSEFMDDVIIDVDLGDQYQVFYVVLQFYSPQPRVVTIEKKKDSNSPWERWQYYAENCELAFGMPNNGPLTTASSVNCIQFGTNGLLVPYSKGNITFSVLAPEPVPRPGHNDFYNTPTLFEFVKASAIRVRLQGHYYVPQGDNLNRHRYYGIYEYIVTGRCNCHGHGETCDTSSSPYKCDCLPTSNTEGNQCERCKPRYNDKPFRVGDQVTAYNCKACQCYGHADSCIYNQTADPFPADHDRGGGGQCVDCKHNTRGRHCDECVQLHFRDSGKSLYATDVCTPCDCHVPGIQGNDTDCDKVGGQCMCKQQVNSRRCDQCKLGYYNLQLSNPVGCEACGCNVAGTVDANTSCHATTGQCQCKPNVRNRRCDACEYGYYSLSGANPMGCTACSCNPQGALNQFCNPINGKCQCKTNVVGQQCDQCADGKFNFEAGCSACDCDPLGTVPGSACNKTSGQCLCKANAVGLRCDVCMDGYYNLGSDVTTGCSTCGCEPAGTKQGSQMCDKTTGECDCKQNVQSRNCNQCKANTYKLSVSNPLGCESCDCDPSGTLSTAQLAPNGVTCDQNTGQCSCLTNRMGRRCETCISNFYVNPVVNGGCNPCGCHLQGSIRGSPCDPITGQCQCLSGSSGIAGRACDQCDTRYFGAVPQCTLCECDISGSKNASCHPGTGQCFCKDFTTERQCGQCIPGTSNLQASNPFGCSKAPNQQPPPNYVPLGPTALRLFWDPPDYPNGVILKYMLYRDGSLVAEVETSVMEYNDTGLTPYTDYQYQVEAINVFGSTRSPVVIYRTPSGAPQGDVTLKVSRVTAHSAYCEWIQPSTANGIIQRFELTSTRLYGPATPQMHYEGLNLNVLLTDLEAYTNYTFRLSVCTQGGCLSSPGVTVITREDFPQDQGPPTIIPVSSSVLHVRWDPPAKPNGVIIYYELWMRGVLLSDGTRNPVERRIFHPAGQYNPLPLPTDLDPPSTNYTVINLNAYTVYEFQVLCENSISKAASVWVAGRTLEDIPLSMPDPVVFPASSTELNVTWQVPDILESRGEITTYRLYLYKASDLINTPFAPPYTWTQVYSGDNSSLYAIVGGFVPYTNHTLRLEACNAAGCVNSSDVWAKTLPGVPTGLRPPNVEGLNASRMEIEWYAPGEINGPEPTYVIRKTKTAFNHPPPEVGKGTRFPGFGYYKFPPETIPQGVAFSGFELYFKTSQHDGLLLFAATEGGQEEFLAVQLRAGRPWFLFDPQGCVVAVTPNMSQSENLNFSDSQWHHLWARREVHTARITIDGEFTGCAAIVTTTDDEGLPYNDNSWHHLLATRVGKKGYIVLDHRWTGEKDAECATGNIIGRNTGVYVGGLPNDYVIQREEDDLRARVNPQGFMGCIRDVRILTTTSPQEQWLPLNWSTVIEKSDAMPEWEGCPLELDYGWHFLGTGYSVYEAGAFVGGNVIDFSFEVRTEFKDGMLFFAHGARGTYFLVQLVSGGIHWEYSDSVTKEIFLFPNDTVNLCDGQWHTVRLNKVGMFISITVDFIFSKENGGDKLMPMSPNLASYFYIGGIKANSEGAATIKELGLDSYIQPSFGGCMFNMRINRRPYDLVRFSVEVLNINMDGCPLYHNSIETCLTPTRDIIYTGNNLSTFDDGLLPFTEYLYQVEVSNSAGSAFSPWGMGRTREGAPRGMSPPFSVQVINGYTITARWRKPSENTGQLTSYILQAYNREKPNTPSVDAVFEDISSRQGTIDNAVPYTNYSVVIVACTAGGCSESTGVHAFTNEEAPRGVYPPEILDASGQYMYLGWKVPAMPNGILTGYFLYMEGREIYNGAGLEFNVTGLDVYTAYRFSVRACSRAGCNSSETISLSTSQLPPTAVDPPKLTILGKYRMRVSWLHPLQLNGVLESYRLYSSTVREEIGEVVYNSTDLFLDYTLDNLVAGTTYYIRVSACTGGGCRLSNYSSGTTEESAPDGVPDPVVTSPNPQTLHITWDPPKLPNGLIIMYKLYHNGLMVYNNSFTREYSITSLQPWSLHYLRVEACTIKGCGSSDEVSSRTQEAPPAGSLGLGLQVNGPRAVSVQWNVVERPNGMLFYDVYFEGLFYVDPKNWDYSTQTRRRSLYQNLTGGQWVEIDGLIPHSSYYVQVNASNTKGFILSNIKLADMPMGSPDGVRPPILTSPDPSSIRAIWEAVGRPNADQEPTFQLQFKDTLPGTQIQNLFPLPTTSTSFLKQGLVAYTEYQFRIVAGNNYGTTPSTWVVLSTKQDRPGPIDPPMTTSVATRSLDVVWEVPFPPNGIITEYKIYQNGQLKDTVPGNMTRWRIEGLIPYTQYIYKVEACTVAGCTISGNSRPVFTLKAPPEGLSAPVLRSPTPTSVLVVWSPPEFPNGDILQYAIERRLSGQTEVTIVRTFLPTDPLEYVDESRELSPHTSYEYRVVATTSVGSGQSPWAQVTTRSSRPGGVQPPSVVVLSPTSISVSWQTPISLNGKLESYVIALPQPRFEIFNISQLSLVVTDLVPFTTYSVTVTACSDGGCSASSPTVVTTSPSVPGGMAAPLPSPHSQTFISVTWQAPAQPNGPNIRYELARMKVRQPLQPGANDFGSWSSVYNGRERYYEDRGLTIYTTYQYRVTVYNDYGHTVSGFSPEVTTFGGMPNKPPLVVANPVSHISVNVTWINPSVFELEGGPSQFIVNLTSANGEVTSKTYDGKTTSTIVTGLRPNTRYTVLVTLVVHGGGSITSAPAYVTTGDGAPEGVKPPRLQVINETTLAVSWEAPDIPNGQVSAYYLYVDGTKVDTGMNTPGTYYLTDLQPYTIYLIQLEVCTIYACVKSQILQGTTAESVPTGLGLPTPRVLGPHAIDITWTPPSRPNGIILRYELLRKTKIPCDQRPTTTPIPPVGKCTYYECGILESFCGSQCYSGPKTCCGGVVHTNKQGYECCGTGYIPRRTNPDDVCCGGKFYNTLENHQCCGGRYVEVLPGHVCCPDTTQDRVDIGPGDRCCHSTPYSSAGSQLCCKGVLHDGYGKQCCGGLVSSDSLICCGNDTLGAAYPTDAGRVCCGSEYVTSSTSVCCTDETGKTKVHAYGSSDAKFLANEKCCGRERISAGLSCCNDKGHNPITQSCADISNQEAGCGTGVICPASQAETAFCNRCNFNRGSQKCGSYSRLALDKPYTTDMNGRTATPGEMCLTDPIKIYTGSQLRFTDESLAAYTEYQYSVVAVNGAGVGQSGYVTTTTAQKLPEGVRPPTARVDPGQLDTIYLSWEPPQQANGEILWYILLREGVEIFRDPTRREYMDNNAIQPYMTYTYKLRVCNVAGCVDSPEVRVATLQAKPEQLSPPSVRVENSRALHFQWTPPQKPNGYISHYTLVQLPELVVANVSGMTREYMLYGLEPYTEYTFVLSACTEVGCTESPRVQVTTSQDTPQGVKAPFVVVIDVYRAEIHWVEPTRPNGVIIQYRLYRSVAMGLLSVINTTSGDVLQYLDPGLQPGALYSYLLEALTLAGGTNSSLTTVTMPIVTPQGIPAPTNVTVLDAYSIYVTWGPPSLPNGIIDQYIVLLNAGTQSELSSSVGVVFAHTVGGLLPYTEYTVRIQACVQGVDNGCGTGPSQTVRTLEAAPQGQPPPTLVALGPSLVQVTWDPPTNPNGIITQYQVLRRQMGSLDQGILIQAASGMELSYNNAGPELTAFTQYQYRIVAVNSVGDTTSDWATVRTLEAPPQVIYAPTVSNIGAYLFSLTWQPPLQSNGLIKVYQIEYKPVSNDPTSPGQALRVTVSGSTTTTSVSGLSPYTPYEVRVVAVNAAGSVASPWTRTTTSQAAPAFVGPFEVERIVNGESVILRWGPPGRTNGQINNYLIYEQGNVNPIYQGLSREFEYRRLQPYTQYTVQLEACTNGGCARSNRQSFYTAEIPPQNQPAPTIGSVNATQVTLRWSKPVNPYGKITSYQVLRRSQGRRSRRAVTDPVVVHRTTDTDKDTYQYTDTGLEPYSTYEYMVRAQNSMGSTDSPWQVVETTSAAPQGVSPPIVSQVGNNHESLRITWSPPTQPNGIIKDYKIQRNNSAPWSFTAEQPREYVDKGLTAYTLYAYTLTVCNSGPNGCTTSTPTVLRTPETAPSFVAPPTVIAVDSTTLTIQWSTPQITNGQIMVYHLKMDGVTVYSGTDMSYTVSNLTPYRAYSFLVTACTYGGCTDSSSVLGRPEEDSPAGMRAPTVRVTGSNSVEIAWQPPDQANGVITSYELRRDGVLIQTTTGLQYIDLEVEPGTEYTYKVTVYNTKGSVTSPPTTVKTYPSAPLGLGPPTLVALSSTSVRASWNPPLKPNGDIYNYTLYKDNEVVFSERQLTTVVTGLDHWTEYSFRIQACTSQGCVTSDPRQVRTKEAPPLGLAAPKLTSLADSNGAHAGVLIEWAPPRRPNGIIIRYDVYRRNATGVSSSLTGGPRKMIYSGMAEQYQDRDPGLRPYTQYEYMVMAFNSEGLVSSAWEKTRTKEAPPEGVPPPVIRDVSETTITLGIEDPAIPNGYIESYNVYLNGVLVVKSRSNLIIIGEMTALQPYTRYTLYVEACTAGGCTKSPVVETRTKSQLPGTILPPVVSNITNSTMQVSWLPPLQPNGPSLIYELLMKQACPHPYADIDDDFAAECIERPLVTKARGDIFSAEITGLRPYTRYEFLLRVRNEGGAVKNASSSARAVTLPAPPEYRRDFPPSVRPAGEFVIVSWPQSFYINGEVIQFTLYKDSLVEYSGFGSSHQVFRKDKSASWGFYVKLKTTEGEAETDRLVFDPSKAGFVDTPAPPTKQPVVAAIPVYQEIWFIVVMAIVAFLLLFLGIYVCLRCSGRRVPYIRERMPLQPRQKKAQIPLGYGIEYGDDSYFNSDLPQPPPSHLAPEAHVGYVNPAYSHLSIPSATPSLIDLNLDKMSHKGSSKWEEEEDLPEWNSHLPLNHDSGLHSLAYGDDYDADSDRPISVLKEHTMFTDTHL